MEKRAFSSRVVALVWRVCVAGQRGGPGGSWYLVLTKSMSAESK